MRMFKYIIAIMLLCFHMLEPVNIGSDTAVTRFNTQQTVFNSDRIAGFASLAAGFSFFNSSVVAAFDSFFGVSGDVALNFGSLNLNQDILLLKSSLSSSGNIRANGYTINFGPSIQRIPVLSSVNEQSCGITSVTNLAAAAQVNSVDWNSSGQYLASGINDPGGTTSQVTVYSWNGTSLTSITGVDINGTVFGVRWHPTNDWIAVARAAGGGNELYVYSFNGVALTLLSSIGLAASANAVDWRPDGNFLAVATAIAGAQLRVYPISGAGAIGAAITASLGLINANDVSWNSDGTLLAVVSDNNILGNELFTYTFNGVALALDAGADVTATTNAVSWNKNVNSSDVIAVGSEVGTGSTLKLFRRTVGALTAIPLSVSVTVATNAVHWNIFGSCLAAGLDTNASGEVRSYTFAGNDLILASDIERSVNVFDVRWNIQNSYVATGDSAPSVSVFRVNSSTIATQNVTWSNANIILNNNTTFVSPSITFTGQSVINALGKTVSLDPTFTLIVGANSSILLKNMTLSNVRAGSLRCDDSLATFSFQNVVLELSDNYTFSQGRWDILGEMIIRGTHVLTYASNNSLTLKSALNATASCVKFFVGQLIIDPFCTFNYAPSGGSANLIVMEDTASEIILRDSLLRATNLNLTKGSLTIDGMSQLECSGTINIGDGSNVLNNLRVEILPAAQLQCLGSIRYNNI